MIKNQKYIFLYALILTFFVFNFGIFMGYLLESSRIDKINSLYIDAEMELLDQMAQRDSFEVLDLDCTSLTEENTKFGDKIFEEALLIQRYEDANRLSEEITSQHKRFDLLRTIFWINSIKIKQKCNPSYHTVVYLYKYNNPSLEEASKQRFFSNLLRDIKESNGGKMMLIPIAADNDIPSMNLLLKKYNITELPVILIDENIKIIDVKDRDDIEKYLV